MMDSSIIVAIISLVGTLGGTFGGILVSSKLTTYRIEQLEKKVEKHNTVIERTYNLERRADNIESELRNHEDLYAEKIKVANHRIDDLERGKNAEN